MKLVDADSLVSLVSDSLARRYLRNAQNRALSHPLPVLRAAEIDTWSRSAEYKNLGR